jgi:hypothetical protein
LEPHHLTATPAQASKVIAQLLVAGATTLLRAGSQAFAKALQSEPLFMLAEYVSFKENHVLHSALLQHSMWIGSGGRVVVAKRTACAGGIPGSRTWASPFPTHSRARVLCCCLTPPADAQQSGVAQEGVKAATRGASMSVQEAQMILGVSEKAPWADVMKVRGVCVKDECARERALLVHPVRALPCCNGLHRRNKSAG